MTLSFVAGRVDITPSVLPIGLSGNGPENRSADIQDRLECSALLVFSGGDPAVVLVSVDTLYVGDRFRRELLAALGPRWADDQVFLAATHTHNAPGLDPEKSGLGDVEEAYLAETVRRVAALISGLVDHGTESNCEIFGTQFRHRLGINRRRKRFLRINRKGIEVGKVGMGPNPDGPVDDLLLASVVVSNGAPIAVMWQAACHPTSFPDPSAITAHYPGFVRERLRLAFGLHDLPVLFLQGFSGDVRPPSPPPPLRDIRAMINRVRLGKGFGSYSEPEYEAWCSRLAARVETAIVQAQPLPSSEVSVIRYEFDASDVVRGPDVKGGTLHLVQFAGISLVGVAAEPVAEYADLVRDHFGPAGLVVPVGCIDAVWGYLPTTKMLRLGGYEARHFCGAFGLEAVAPERETNFMAHLARAKAELDHGDNRLGTL